MTFNTEGMVIHIASSKTDQYREGASLVTAHTSTATCPVSMMQCAMGQLVHESLDFIFGEEDAGKKKARKWKRMNKGTPQESKTQPQVLPWPGSKVQNYMYKPSTFTPSYLLSVWRFGGKCGDLGASVEIWGQVWRFGGKCGDLGASVEI